MLFGLGGIDSLFALDIGTSTIKAAKVEKKRGEFCLNSFSMVSLAEDSIVDGEVIQQAHVIDAITEVKNQAGINEDSVCTSVSGSSLILKHITLPKTNPKELEDQVYWEAEQYIPFDMADIRMDFEVLQEETADGKTEILLAAAKNDFIEKRMNVVRDAGLEPVVLDVDSLALANVYWANYDVPTGSSSLLVDFGASMVKLNIVTDRTTLFTRDIAIGGKDLTLEIQNKLGITFQEAELLKIESSASEEIPENILGSINSVTENIVLELRRSLDFFSASNSEYPIGEIFVCGGSCRIPGLMDVLEEMVGLPVQYLNPFERISFNTKAYTEEYIEAIAPSSAIPIGLALRNFE